MLALLSLFAVIVIALVVTRIATVILTLTGLSREAARFQARSALTGVGFTTSEAESVVNHPVRRRVVMALMLTGSAGVVTAIATLMLSFVGDGGTPTGARVAILLGGLLVLVLVARSSAVDRVVSRLIERALGRWTTLDVRDYAALLHLGAGYTIVEAHVEAHGWVAGRTLAELRLPEEGVRVLGIVRGDGRYVGAPIATTEVQQGDTLVIYGRGDHLDELIRRKSGAAGDAAHERAVERQRRLAADRSAETAPRPRV